MGRAAAQEVSEDDADADADSAEAEAEAEDGGAVEADVEGGGGWKRGTRGAGGPPFEQASARRTRLEPARATTVSRVTDLTGPAQPTGVGAVRPT